MKKLLLFSLILFTLAGYSQHPILQYMGSILTEPVEGVSTHGYWALSAETPLNQAATGENMSWTFDELDFNSIYVYYNANPTAAELGTFPNSNIVTTLTTMPLEGAEGTTSKAYANKSGGAFSITGAASNGLTLNYNTDQGTVGSFPMSYGYSNMDTVGGTYNYETYSGNFTGTISSTVDAYGSLTVPLPSEPDQITFNVTRLKTVQTVSLSYGFFPNVGTVTQTAYHYYRALSEFPSFKTTTTHISIPLLSIDQTENLVEAADWSVFLANQNFNKQNAISIVPNPVSDQLFIQKSISEKIQSLNIHDISGKIILQFENPENTLNVNQLQKGVYFAQIKTDSGTFTKKIVKK